MPPLTFRRWTRGFLIGCAALLGLVVVALALLQTSPVATWAARGLVRLIPLNPGYRFEIGRVSGNWVTALQLEHVKLRRADRELARIDRLRLGYDPRQLRGAKTRLRSLTVDGFQAIARREKGGWDLAHALRRSADTSGGGGVAVDRLELRNIDIEAQLASDSTLRVRDLSLQARNLVVGDVTVAILDTLSVWVAPPTRSPLWLAVAGRGAATPEELRFDRFRITTTRSNITGRAVLPRRFDDPRIVDRLALQLEASPLALADVATVIPSVRREGVVRLEVHASADGQLATGDLKARLGEASLTLDGSTMLGTGVPTVYRAHGVVRGLDPAGVYLAAPVGQLNGDITADLSGPNRGHINGPVDLRVADSRIGGTAVKRLGLRADFKEGRAKIVLRGAVGTATVAAEGWARPFDSLPSYQLSGGVRQPSQSDSLFARLAWADENSVLDLRFRLAGEGIAPSSARLTAHADLAAVRQDGERAPLGKATLALTRGQLTASPELLVAGGRIAGLATLRFGDTVAYQVRRGTVDHVDLGRLLGDTIVAPLSGRFTLWGRGVAPAEAVATARIEFDELRYGARRIERMVAVARLESGRAQVETRGELQGGRLVFNAVARPFDSVGTFTIRRASLEGVDLGTLFGQPALAGPATIRAHGNGRWSGKTRSLRARVDLDPLRLRRINITGGVLTTTVRGDRITYDGSLRTSQGSVGFAGDGRFAAVPSWAIHRGRADSIDLGALLGRPDLRTSLNSRFTASATGRGLDSLRSNVDIELLPSRVNEAELRSGRLTLALDRGGLRGNMRMESPDGEVGAELSGHVTGRSPELRADGSVRLQHLARWTGRRQTDGHLAGRFTLQGVGDDDGLLTVGGMIAAAGAVGEVRLDSLHLALRPEPGAIAVDTVLLRSNVATLDGSGAVALRPSAGTDTLRVIGRARDLAPLAALAGTDSVSLDSGRVALTVTGPAWQWQFTGRADAHRLLYAGKQAEHVTARGSALVDSTRVAGMAGEVRVEGAAVGPVTINEAAVTGRYDSVIALQATATLDDSVRFAAAMQGAVVADTVRTQIERLELVEGGRSWALEQPAGLMLRPRVEVSNFALRTGNRRIVVDGTLDLRGSSDLSLRLDGVDLDVFRELGLAPIPGRLDGELRLAGPAATPTLEGRLGLSIRQRGGQELGRVASELSWTAAGLRFDAAAGPQQGGRLTARGTLPWRLTLAPADTSANIGVVRGASDTLGVVVRADSFDLAFFNPLLSPETAKDLRGGLTLDARVAGTLDEPRVDGGIRLAGAGVTLPVLDITYEQGELVGNLAGDQLRIDRLRLLTGKKQELTAQGSVRLKPVANPALDLTADLQDFRVSNSSTLRAIASGKLRLRGTAEVPSLTGTLTLGRTEVFQGAESQGAAVDKVELTPADLHALAQYFGPAALAHAHEEAGLVQRFQLDLDLRLPREVWFRRRVSPKIDVELSGRMRVRQAPGQPMQFVGRVELAPDRGSLDIYGRNFRLTDGEIILAGPVDSTTLDVTAQYEVPTQAGADAGIVIDVAAKGRPDSLALEFSAEPTMSQDDIISYIVTGRPASENPLAGQSTSKTGAELAFNRLSEQVAGAAGEKLGLDVFQIRQDGLRGLTLTAGRYVAPRVFLSLQQPIQLSRDAQEAPGTSHGPGFEVDYAARRWLRANLRGGSLPPRFFLRGRYTY